VSRKPTAEPFSQEALDSADALDCIAEDMAADSGPRVFLQDSIPDKYSLPAAEPIDCENRVALCKAACCRLSVLLSPQDLAEGIVSWDPRRRYFNSQDADGYCVHLERPPCRCSIYANRPAPCRIYDCRHDSRIWVDFEKRITNPALDQLNWPFNLDLETAHPQTRYREAESSGKAPDGAEARALDIG
jgi:hypothetical protein